MAKSIAHVKKARSEEWLSHSLYEHSLATASSAKTYADIFQSAEWGWLAGLWHDIGKARPAFQAYIKKASGYDPNASITSEFDSNKNHASTGAMHAFDFMEKHGKAAFGKAIAYMIAGHHAGLPDYTSGEASGRSLEQVLLDKHFLTEARDVLAIESPELLAGKIPVQSLPIDDPKDFHLWIRMVFSALVDADFLDTEGFMNQQPSKARDIKKSKMSNLLSLFNAHMEALTSNAEASDTDENLNNIRAEVLQQAREKGNLAEGIYTMTVPTGGGKTLSSLAFALEHACKHKKRRIIYAIPYTSIIDQTARIFRDVFCGEQFAVLEHHCNVEVDANKENTQSRLSAENWDAPIVVTTTVQLFESLFAAKPSRCRKLHNIADSVIVLDETQLLPIGNLNPIRHVIRLLQKHYDVSFLLTTATPTPTKGIIDPMRKQLLVDIPSTEIVDDPLTYYQKLRRVRYSFPADFHQPEPWEDIAKRLCEHRSVLAIVSRRQDARDLFAAMPPSESLFHLSALMCPSHRKIVIQEITSRLKRHLPTQVISTQLVEAGVDLDFPVVFRAAAGLDSIIQAAGRCNREGKLKDASGTSIPGSLVVFVPPKPPPDGFLNTSFQTASSLISGHNGEIDTPSFINTYFEHLYARLNDFDSRGVLSLLWDDADEINIQFRSAALNFQMIDQGETVTLFTDYSANHEEGKKVDLWLNMLASGQVDRWLIRNLQPFSITLYRYQLPTLLANKAIKETESGFYVIGDSGVYDSRLGFVGTEPANNQSVY